MTITHMQSEIGDLVYDDSCAPIFFANNRGHWTAPVVEKWYQVRNESFHKAIAQGHKVFHIGNFANVATPDALLRQKIAEYQKAYDVDFMRKETWIGQCYIIPNPIMRGFITAVQWMAGEFAAPATTASDLEGALKIARKAYGKFGLELPPVPADYQFPECEGTLPRGGIPRGGLKVIVKPG